MIARQRETKSSPPRREPEALPGGPAMHPVLQLQQEAGNQAVAEWLRAGAIRAKLAISSPDDPDEKEADRVAENIMRSSEDHVSAGAPCPCMLSGREMCEECRQKQGVVQRRASRGGRFSAVPANIDVIRNSSGQPLESSSRQFFEPAFGQGLGHIRIHTGTEAAASARSIDALAYTAGNHIVFGAGHYAPDSSVGRRLLAHELTHTLQQQRGRAFIQRQAAPDGGAPNPLPVPGGPQEVIRNVYGIPLVDDDATIRIQLLNLLASGGRERLSGFVAALKEDYETDEMAGERPAAGVPENSGELEAYDTQKAKERKVLDKVLAIVKELEDFLVNFEAEARDVASKALDDSEKHVLAEAVRYGVTNLHEEVSWLGDLSIAGDVADNASTRGIAIAAQGLLDRKRKASKAMEDYKDYASGAPAILELAADRLHDYETQARVAEMRDAITRTQRDLDVYRFQVQNKFPLLAALSSDEDFHESDLEDLARGDKGANSDATKVIVDQVVEKLVNIQKVREELKPGGDVNIWRVPKLVESTRLELDAAPGTLKGLMVDEKVKSEQPSELTGILIGILQLGLVLLAPVTEGLSLIPAAALSVGTAYEHFKEYETGKALHGTDFGAAALSAEDPSLFGSPLTSSALVSMSRRPAAPLCGSSVNSLRQPRPCVARQPRKMRREH